MSYNLYCRSDGTASVFLNGFLLISKGEEENSTSKVNHFLKNGENILEIHLQDPNESDVLVKVFYRPDDPPPEAVPEPLVQFSLPGEEALGTQRVILPFQVPPGLPEWWWVRHSVPAPDDAEHVAYTTLRVLADLLRSGPDGVLQEHLNLKHAEISAAFGLDKGELDDSLSEGLSARREAPGFSVQLATEDEVFFAWSSDRTVARALRRDGQDAILITTPDGSFGFQVFLGWDGTGVTILR